MSAPEIPSGDYDRLADVLAAWRDEIHAAPLPDISNIDTEALAAVLAYEAYRRAAATQRRRDLVIAVVFAMTAAVIAVAASAWAAADIAAVGHESARTTPPASPTTVPARSAGPSW